MGILVKVLADFPLKIRKRAKRVQKAKKNPACGGLTQNNDERQSIRSIPVDFGRRRRLKIFGVDFKFSLKKTSNLFDTRM